MFDYPRPPRTITERQFDYCDEGLARLAATPYPEIDFSDLWYYIHDLAYVELQPDLFAYLFPVCLMDWHLSLQRNDACAHGDAEFHHAVRQGNVLEKMLSSDQLQLVNLFLHDSFLERLAAEQSYDRMFGWIYRFNSLAMTFDTVPSIWNSWLALTNRGCAIAAIEYCTSLIYPEMYDKAGPCLWQHDGYMHHGGWQPTNLRFIEDTLTVAFIRERLAAAVECLRDSPEFDKAVELQAELSRNEELCELQIDWLKTMLANPRG